MAKTKKAKKKRKLPTWEITAARERLKKFEKPTRDNPLKISASELKTFLRCRVKWNWRYNLKYVAKAPARNLLLGSLVHLLLEKWYSLADKKRTVKAMERIAKKTLKATSPDELSVEDLQLAQAMVVGYAAWAKLRDAKIKLRKIEPEMWFDYPLTDSGLIRVRGKVDAVFGVGSLKNTMGCFEHKTKKAIRIDMVDMNLQLTVYLWALRKRFPKAKRYIAYYNVLRKQMPGPRVKADLFVRESVERSKDEIAQWEIDTERAVLDMLDCAIYPNPMDACGWDCDYETPCMMRGRPGDLQSVLKRDYKKKERR